MSANPEQRISELPLLTDSRAAVNCWWSGTTPSRLSAATSAIHQLFEEQVERTPDAVAVVFEDEQLTYRELNRRANQLAHYLQSAGSGPETLVGICVERSWRWSSGYWAFSKPAAPMCRWIRVIPEERLAFMLEDSKAQVLITQSRLDRRTCRSITPVTRSSTQKPKLSDRYTDDESQGGRTIADNLAYVIYTSGSTGQTKGCCDEPSSAG